MASPSPHHRRLRRRCRRCCRCPITPHLDRLAPGRRLLRAKFQLARFDFALPIAGFLPGFLQCEGSRQRRGRRAAVVERRLVVVQLQGGNPPLDARQLALGGRQIAMGLPRPVSAGEPAAFHRDRAATDWALQLPRVPVVLQLVAAPQPTTRILTGI
jgi:hypothetical protein